MASVTFGYSNYLICSERSVWHIHLKMNSISSKICGSKKPRKKRSAEKDGILAWHKVSEHQASKHSRRKHFYSHTLVIAEQGSPLERLLALEYEQKFLMRAGGMTNNLISSKRVFEAHTTSGEMDRQQRVKIPNTPWCHGRRIGFAGKGWWQKFSNLPAIAGESSLSRILTLQMQAEHLIRRQIHCLRCG